ncbi:MAG: CDP-diacylglycerol--serine O-phosphatidyltransferase [Magnetococcales bacterium]|nr:CDP-diacylglycerol--serine O-phosphatidyltransferase [Magnetococcales bacterium]
MQTPDSRPEAPRPSKRVYILPNLLTTGGLFFGFYAIMNALDGRVERAAVAILVAGIFDLLDGRVARATGGVSAFGKEYDSLADFLSFGIAPGILVYQWALAPFSRLGMAGAFLFMVCSALRLARFNVQHYVQDERLSRRYFQGLPVPAAAGVLVATILFLLDIGVRPWPGGDVARNFVHWWPLLMTYFLAFLMVSTIRFRSFKDITWHRERPFFALVVAVSFIAILTISMPITLFVVGLIYLASALPSHREYRQLLAEGKETEGDEVKDLSI